MPRLLPIAAALAISVLALSACAPAAKPHAAAPRPAVTVTVTPTPTPSAAPVVATPGIGATISSAGVDATVYSLDQNAAANGPQPEGAGDKWMAIDVQRCNTEAGTLTLSSNSFTLVSTDNRRFQPSSIGYQSFPEPDQTFGDTDVANGECARGWIVFTVNKDAVIATVNYLPSGGAAVKWIAS